MQSMKRRRLSADAWREMVEKFEVSGLSAEGFSEQERISLAGLQRWRQAKGRAKKADDALVARPRAPLVATSAPGFVDLGQKKDVTIETQQQQIDGLKHQIEWFKRQIFGAKSERFAPEPDPSQLPLGAVLAVAQPPRVEPRQSVPAHTRRVPQHDAANDAESLPFFDESRVPVHTIEAFEPEIAALDPDQYEVIDKKVSYRLGQRPGSYVVFKYVRPVVKRRDTKQLSCASAPLGVIEGRSKRAAPARAR